MLSLNKNDIVLIIFGDKQFIGTIKDISEERIVLDKACILHTVPVPTPTGQMAITVVLEPYFGQDLSVPITHCAISIPNKELRNKYIEQTSGIAVASSVPNDDEGKVIEILRE